MNPTYDYRNRVTFITGGGSSLGHETALAFAQAGASVSAVDQNGD